MSTNTTAKTELDRVSREQESREVDEGYDVYDDDFLDDDMLSMKNIPARPGFQRRWIRTHSLGEQDQMNLFKKHNSGWRPVMLDSIAKGKYVMSVEFGGHTVIGIKGVVLMERPEQLHVRAKVKVLSNVNRQMEAVNYNMFNTVEKSNRMEKPPEVSLNKEATAGGREARSLIDD